MAKKRTDVLKPRLDTLPVWIALPVAGATVAANALLPAKLLATLGFVGLAVAALTVDALHHRHRPAVLTAGLVLAWCGLSSIAWPLFGPVRALVTVGGTLWWMTLIIGWRTLGYRWKWIAKLEQKHDHRQNIHLLKQRWPKIASQMGISDDSTLIDAEPTPTGVRLDVATPGDAGALIGKAGTVASALGVGREDVTVVPDPGNAAIAHIEVRTIDPLATKPEGWRPPELGDYSITFGMDLGPDEDGRKVHLDFVAEGWQVTGIPRSGKTHVLHMVCACAAYARDAILVVIETAKQGADFRRWQHCSTIYAVTPDQAIEAVDWLYRQKDERYGDRSQRRATGNWDPRKEGPQIIVVVDEASNAMRLPYVQERLRMLAMEAPGAGITMVIGTQVPQHAIFDVNTRRVLSTRISLATDSSQASDMALDAGLAAAGFDSSTLRKGGECYVKHVGSRRPVRARAFWIPDLSLDHAAARLPEVVHVAPHPDLQIAQAGADSPTLHSPDPDVALPPPDPTETPERGLAPVVALVGRGQDVAPPDGAVHRKAGREEACGPGSLAVNPGLDVSLLLERANLTYAEAVYRLMVEEGPTSQTKVHQRVACTHRTAARTLKRLVEVGLARQVGELWAAITPEDAMEG